LKSACSEAQERIKTLEKENAELKEEVEVVKKLTSETVKAENKNVVISSAVVEEEAEEAEEEAEEAEEEDLDPSTFPDLKHKGKVYKKSTDNTLYLETEEGWEEVGKWDAATKTIIEEAEEEADPELTEFQYKGKIYFLDNDNNVFEETDEGYEQVGTWNGKKILFE
jgi:ribosome-binding ATPase YchF (GTP1/OBG family)